MTRRRFVRYTVALASSVALSSLSTGALASGAAPPAPSGGAPPAAAAPAQPPANIAGAWIGIVTLPEGRTAEVEVTFAQSGADVTAKTVNKTTGRTSSGEGTVTGNKLTLRAADGRSASYVVNGDEMKSVDTRLPITMRRKK